MEDPNKYVGSVFVWDEQKVKEIMQDIVNFTKKSDNNIKWNDESYCFEEKRKRRRNNNDSNNIRTIKES